MNAFVALSVTELRLFFRERQAVFWTFLYPLAMLWLFGEIFGKQQINGVSYSDMYVPSWIGVNLLTVSLYTIGTTLAGYRERGILKRFQATPVRPWVVLAAHATFGLVIFLISLSVLILEGALLFHLDAPKSLSGTLIGLLVSILALFPFGLFIAALARNTRTSAALSAIVLNVMLLFSGATFPLTLFPVGLRAVAKVFPLYYVVDLLRHAWNAVKGSSVTVDVIVLLSICVVTAALASRLFRWQSES